MRSGLSSGVECQVQRGVVSSQSANKYHNYYYNLNQPSIRPGMLHYMHMKVKLDTKIGSPGTRHLDAGAACPLLRAYGASHRGKRDAHI